MTSGAHTLHFAGFWRRLSAFILDSALYSALLLPVSYLLYGRDYFIWLAQDGGLFGVYSALDFVLNYLLPVFLIVVCWVRWGATPGKLLLDCRVVDAETLQPLGWKKALLRCLAYIISALPLYLGFVWIGFDKRKQGLHDKLAGTLVLYQPDEDAHRSLDELMEGVK